MKIIPTKVHGFIDYLTGGLLIAAPWLFGFADNTAATYVPVVLGIGAILYSLLTNYEMGAAKVISMRTHLLLDIMSGVLLAASPWLFGFDDRVFLPHLVVGLMEIVVSLLTERSPRHAAISHHAHTNRTHHQGA